MTAFASITAIDVRRIRASSAMWQSSAQEASAGQSVWHGLKEIFSTPVKSVESLINARENFKNFFQEQSQKLGMSVPPRHQDRLLKQGAELMQQILEGSLNQVMDAAILRGDGKIGEPVLRQALSRAHERAQLALMELESNALRTRMADVPVFDLRPQIVVSQQQSIQLIRPAPRIENLVLRGGGAKGIGTAPALMELENAGFLKELKTVVGTSVGALVALSMASGQRPEEIARVADQLDMAELKDKPQNFEARYPGVNVDWRVGFHTGRALELLDQISAGSVSSYLEKNWNSRGFRKKLRELGETNGPGALARLDTLRQQDFETDRTGQMITFADLALLQGLDPARFKALVLTAWDDTRKRMDYFSVVNAPDMPIAVAGRISMSLPVIFKSVTYDPGDGQGARTFVDGGVGSNMPTEVITDGLSGNALAEARSRTAVMTFDDNGGAYAAMHQPPRERNGLRDWIMSLITGNPSYGRSSMDDKAKVAAAGPNAFVVFHGDIETLDLGASKEQVEKAKLMSTLKTLEQIEQRQGQACAVECRSVGECFAMLTRTEKEALREGGAPSPLDYPKREADLAYRLQRQLYELSLPGWRPAPISMLV